MPISEHKPLRSADTHTGRTVMIISVIAGLVGAAAPVVANMDVSSTAGIVAGIVGLSAIVVKYLDGWQRYEARLDAPEVAPPGDSSAESQRLALALRAALAPPVGEVGDVPGMSVNGDAGAPAGAAGYVVAGEVEAPALEPGELDDPGGVDIGDEPADIPQPPDDDEINAVELDDPSPPADAATVGLSARDDAEPYVYERALARSAAWRDGPTSHDDRGPAGSAALRSPLRPRDTELRCDSHEQHR